MTILWCWLIGPAHHPFDFLLAPLQNHCDCQWHELCTLTWRFLYRRRAATMGKKGNQVHFHNSRALGIGPRVFVTETSVVSRVIIVDCCSTSRQGYFQGPPIMTPFMVSLPYYSQIFRDSSGSGMGIVWETYHKGVPFLGVPENLTDLGWKVELGAALHMISGNDGWSQVKGWWNPEKTWSIHNHNNLQVQLQCFLGLS